jgi:hypothetical protein
MLRSTNLAAVNSVGRMAWQASSLGAYGNMKLTIDNLDGQGARDYTEMLDSTNKPRIFRKLNRPTEMHLSLISDSADFVVPSAGARVMMGRANGSDVFTGYVVSKPKHEYLGFGERGPIYRYRLTVRSDEFLLDRKSLPARSPFVGRAAGEVLRQMAEDLLPGGFDTSAVADLDVLPWYVSDPRRRWSEHAAEIGLRVRGCYRAESGKLRFTGIGASTHSLAESSPDFCADGLKLDAAEASANDVTIVGRLEPRAYVKDYFVGDGLSLHFDLSQTPFIRQTQVLLDEEYKGGALDPRFWRVSDAVGAISVAAGKLRVSGGTGAEGQTTVQFVEKVELGGALVLQHGDVSVEAAGDGIVGGLFAGGMTSATCIAGFRVSRAGSACNIQPVINGIPSGTGITSRAGHRYALTTRVYASEIYRRRLSFHSSLHPAGNGIGGGVIPAEARVVMEVHDLDPANPGSVGAPSMVLYDGVIAGAPDYCAYVLVNAQELYCSIAFTRVLRAVDAEVRSALPGQPYRTRLAGSLSEGAECRISAASGLQFFAQAVPAPNELIVVRYRGAGRAIAHHTDQQSIERESKEGNDGIRSAVWQVASPSPRMFADCSNAAQAILDDSTKPGVQGEYHVWSDFFPAAGDIFPGDAIEIDVPSRGVTGRVIVREVELELTDPANDRCDYVIRFADEAAAPLAFRLEEGSPLTTTDLNAVDSEAARPADLALAEVTAVSSTTVTVDAGCQPVAGGGIEVRRSDSGWGPDNDRNLIGRFAGRILTLPRLTRVQDYFLRQYDATMMYSRNPTALHIDYPL